MREIPPLLESAGIEILRQQPVPVAGGENFLEQRARLFAPRATHCRERGVDLDDAKEIFGRRGNFGWKDSCWLCLRHPNHASFFVQKLWSYFVPIAPDAATERVFVTSTAELPHRRTGS